MELSGPRIGARLAFVLPVWVAVLGSAWLYLAAPAAYVRILRLFDVPPGPHGLPFFDARFIPDALECWRRGIDVYHQNPCDWLGRLQDYSPLFLRLDFLPAGDGAAFGYGIVFLACFLLALPLLPMPRLRPVNWVLFALATVSPATAYAAERGNIDLLMVACLILAARLLSLRPPWRLAGYALTLAAAAIKFYPILALAAALRERRFWFATIAAGVVAGVAVFAWRFGSEVPLAVANTEQGYLGDYWGAKALPFGVFEILRAQHSAFFRTHAALAAAGPIALLALLGIGSLLAAIRVATEDATGAALARLPPPTLVGLVVGGSVVCGVFAAHLNLGYRTIVFLIGLPGLLAVAEAARGGVWNARALAASVVVVGLCLLATTIPHGPITVLIWLVKQAAAWWLASVYAGVLLRFAVTELARLGGVPARRAAALPAHT